MFIKNERTGELMEFPPYKCKLCGLGNIDYTEDICPICGWQDCNYLFNNPNEFGGPSILTFNQYKKVWENNANEIQKLQFGKSKLVKKIFESNPKLYGTYSQEQLVALIERQKRIENAKKKNKIN